MTITVGLLGHSVRNANLGVGALTVSEIEILRSIAAKLGTQLDIHIIDWQTRGPQCIDGPDITIHEMTGKSLIDPKQYWSYVRKCDLVIDIGAGDSFADIYGSRRLTRMFWMKYLVHLARCPMVLGPQTYGPFTKPLSIRLTRGTLKRSALVVSRDAKSTKAVEDMLPGADVIEASDVALRLPYTAPAPRAPEGKPKVGLNISGLLMNGGYTGNNMFGLSLDYPAMIRQLLTRLLSHAEPCEIHLVGHVVAEGQGLENDRTAALALQEEFPELHVAPLFTTPSEAKSYIAGMDFFAGARMHACIAAFSTNVAVVPMAYSRKFEGLFGTLGYTRTVDCTSESAEVIIDKVVEGYEQRATLLEEQRPALALGLEKLARYEDALGSLIAKIHADKAA